MSDNCICYPTQYTATATITSSVNIKNIPQQSVLSTATLTASSAISTADAIALAQTNATTVAKGVAQHDANIIDQTLNILNNNQSSYGIYPNFNSITTTSSTYQLTTPGTNDPTTLQVIYNNSSAAYSLLGSSSASGIIFAPNLLSNTEVGTITPGIYTTAYDSTNNRLYIGGNFKNIETTNCNGIAYYDFTLKTWNAFTRTSGTTTYTGISLSTSIANNTIFSIKVDSIGNVYVGGNFTQFLGYTATGLALYNKTLNAWATSGGAQTGLTVLPSLGTSVLIYSLSIINNVLYIGGAFTASVSPYTANNIVSYTIGTSTLTVVGTSTSNANYGVNSTVYALETDGTNIYLGGIFSSTKDGSTTLSAIAKYSGSGALIGINNGISGSCFSLLYNSTKLYVGGLFSYAGSSVANNLAVVSNLSATSPTWVPLSTQVSGLITSLAIHSSTNYLYIGTLNTGIQIYDLTNNVAIATNIQQSTQIFSLYIDSSSNLYIGGKFIGLGNAAITSLGYINLNNILTVKYNGITLASLFENGTGAVFAYYNSTWNNITNFVAGL